jgi:hypothetical protein
VAEARGPVSEPQDGGSGTGALLVAGGLAVVAALAPLAVTGPLLAAVWGVAGVALAWIGERQMSRAGRASLVIRSVGLVLLALAAGWLLVRESYPTAFGGEMAGEFVRAVGYAVTIGAFCAAAYLHGGTPGRSRTLWSLVGGANLLLLWYISFEITLHIDSSRARLSGQEGLVVAAAWALYGLALAVADRVRPHRNLRYASRALVGAGLILLVLGALLANARWAWPVYRYSSYTAVLGSAWLSEYLFERTRGEDDIHGLLSLAAAMGGIWVIAFEVVRLLEPAFVLPMDQLITFEQMAWQKSMLAFWTSLGWGLYGLLMAAAGVWLRSRQTRYMALATLGLAAGYLLVSGAPNPAAPLGLRLAAYAVAAGGLAGAAQLGKKAPGERHAREGLVWKLAGWSVPVLVMLWIVLEVLR